MNKQLWLDHFDKVINTFLMDPAENWEFWLIASVGFLLHAWVFTRIGERMDVSNVEGFAGFIAAAVGTAVMLAGMTAASIYVAPAMKVGVTYFFLLIVALIASVVLAVPSIKLWTQAKYFNISIAWFVAFASAVVVMACFSYGFGSFKTGEAKVRKQSQEKHQSVQEILDYHNKVHK
jgi:hypothetical protein